MKTKLDYPIILLTIALFLVVVQALFNSYLVCELRDIKSELNGVKVQLYYMRIQQYNSTFQQ